MATLQIVFVLLASSLMLFWLVVALIGPRKMDTKAALVVLHYGSVLRVLALAIAIIVPAWTIFVVWNFIWKSDTTLATAGGAFLTISLIAGLLLIEVERTQLTLSEEGISRQSPWTGSAFLKWSEIERVSYSAVNRWVVVGGAGKTIRVSRHLVGFAEFIRLARQKISADRYASAAPVFDAFL